MKDKSLPRRMLLTEPNELADFKKIDELHKKLADFVTKMKYEKELKWGVLDLVNEVIYQCVKVKNDPSPEDNIYRNYLESVGNWSGNGDGKAYLVFSLVWAVLMMQPDNSEEINTFLTYLKPSIGDTEEFVRVEHDFFPKCSGLVLNYTPNPSKQSFPADYEDEDIQEMTKDYDYDTVISIIKRYQTIEDQHFILKVIDDSYERTHLDLPF